MPGPAYTWLQVVDCIKMADDTGVKSEIAGNAELLLHLYYISGTRLLTIFFIINTRLQVAKPSESIAC